MKKALAIAIPAFLILIGVVTTLHFLEDKAQNQILRVSGNMEVTQASLSFKIPGILLERLVDEGQRVSAGQLIAKLESTDQQLAVTKAEAGLVHSKAFLAELEAGSRPEEIKAAWAQVQKARSALAELERGSREQEIADARAELERALAAAQGARSQFLVAKADYGRFKRLLEDNVISPYEYDAVLKKYETAQSTLEEANARVLSSREKLSLRLEGPRTEQIDQARAAFRRAQAEHALVKAGPRQEAIDQARAQVQVARESLREAKQHLAYTRLYSPFEGVILSKAAEKGEYLNPGSPVVSVGDLNHIWLRAYVNETDLGRIKQGQAATVTTDTYPAKTYQGHISFISSEAEFTPKSVQTFEERVKLVYRIKIDIHNPDWELKPGMPGDALIRTGG